MTERLLSTFKKYVLSFIEELTEQFPEDPTFIAINVYVSCQLTEQQIMNKFITRVLPYKEKIRMKDEKFFLENCDIFETEKMMSMNTVNKFKEMWESSKLDDEDKEKMFEWFRSFIILAEQYQKKINN